MRWTCGAKQLHLLSMLATATHNHPFDWEDQLPKVCMAYNSSIHASTGFTPFYLMFGRQARLPIDLAYGTPVKHIPTSEYAKGTKTALEEAYALVQQKLNAAHRVQKTHYDRNVHGQPFSVGDLVWLLSPAVPRGQNRKLYHPWSGPYRVVDKLSESDYHIKKLTGCKKIQVVHYDRLKPCDPDTRWDDLHLPDPAPPNPTAAGTPPDLFEPDLLDTDDDTAMPPPPGLPLAGSPPAPPAPTRYPTRSHARPDRYGTYVAH